MQSAVRINCRGDKIFYIALVTHIGLHKDGFATFALDRFDCFRPDWIDIADHNLGAALRKEKGCCAPNSSGAACNERDPASKIERILGRRHGFYLTGAPGTSMRSFGGSVAIVATAGPVHRGEYRRALGSTNNASTQQGGYGSLH